MDGAVPLGVRAGVGTGAGFGVAIHERAVELGTALRKFHAVMAHFKTDRADGHTVRAKGEIIFVLEFHAPAFIEGNEGYDTLPAAVFVDGHSVVSGVKEQFGDLVLWQKVFMVKKQ